MAITRANLETVLIRRAGTWLTASGLDGTTINGTNAALSDPIADALLLLDYTVADISNVTDSDLASVPAASYRQLLDVAELRVLESALENYKKVGVKAGAVEAKLDELGQRMERAVDRKRAVVAARYGIDGATMQAGVIDLNFQQQHDTTPVYYI
jgi:hypothetical protein